MNCEDDGNFISIYVRKNKKGRSKRMFMDVERTHMLAVGVVQDDAENRRQKRMI